MLSVGERTILYIGGLFFILLVAFVLYKFEFAWLFLPILVISGGFNFLWIKVVLDSRKVTNETFLIKQTEDRGTPYMAYMSSFISIVPLFEGGVYGLMAFTIILIAFYFIYINSDIMYYNPFLATAGFKFFKVALSTGSEIYVISRERVMANQKITLNKITDYTYLAT
jgi:divalent metal cation (Fe/Co/Zn/Cd) transporter